MLDIKVSPGELASDRCGGLALIVNNLGISSYRPINSPYGVVNRQ